MGLDWEDFNKRAFVQMVQMWLLKSEIDAERAMDILYEAHRIRKAGIREDLPVACREFLKWQIENGPMPKWVTHPNGAGIP